MSQDEGTDPAFGTADMADLHRRAEPGGTTDEIVDLLLVRVEHLEAVVNAHADLFQSIGVLASVFGVSADEAPGPSTEARRRRPAPPSSAAD